MKKQKNSTITKETIIIVGLVCFIAGYALNGLVGSIKNFKTTGAVSNGVISQSPINNNSNQEQDGNFKDANYWINLGNSYFDSDQYNDAIAAYLKALEMDPDNPDVLSDLGVMYRRSGKPKEAISAFDKAYKVDPSHPMSLFNKGIVLYYDLDRKDAAVKVWKLLISIDPGFKMPSGELISDFLDKLK